jgi:AraC-like DNA-binding protein
MERDDTYFSYKQMLALIENALALTTTPGLGLLVGSRENISSWGVLGYAIMSCATFRESFDIGMRFHRTAAGMMLMSTREEGDRLKIQMDSPCPLGAALPFCVEEMMAGIIAVSSMLVQHKFLPLEVSLTYPRPEYAQRYQKIFRCPVHFDQPINAFWITPPDDTSLTHSDPITARISLKLVQQMVERHSSDADFVLEVRRILLRSPGQFPDMESVADELGMSSRSLRRKLNELDTSFKEVLDDVRRHLAIDYLQNSTLSLEEISALLGYTEGTNFRRAFKLWTGHPPSHYRRA